MDLNKQNKKLDKEAFIKLKEIYKTLKKNRKTAEISQDELKQAKMAMKNSAYYRRKVKRRMKVHITLAMMYLPVIFYLIGELHDKL